MLCKYIRIVVGTHISLQKKKIIITHNETVYLPTSKGETQVAIREKKEQNSVDINRAM